jgi:membrane-associated phospholipid phosphatase
VGCRSRTAGLRLYIYDERMQLGTARDAPRHTVVPRLLLPGPFRMAGAVLVAACVAVTVVVRVHFLGRPQYPARGRPGWLNSVVDSRLQAALRPFPALIRWLPDLGTLAAAILMTMALVLACLAVRRWSGAILAAVAVPAAGGVTEYLLKPLVVQPAGQPSFPSGHATTVFALAAICAILLLDPPHRRVPGPARLILALMALLVAAAVAAAMVAIGAHYFTDAVAGAAVGTGVVLACALTLDLAGHEHSPGTHGPGRHHSPRASSASRPKGFTSPPASSWATSACRHFTRSGMPPADWVPDGNGSMPADRAAASRRAR